MRVAGGADLIRCRPLHCGDLPDLGAAITLLDGQAKQPAGLAQGGSNPKDGQGIGGWHRRHTCGETKAV